MHLDMSASETSRNWILAGTGPGLLGVLYLGLVWGFADS